MIGADASSQFESSVWRLAQPASLTWGFLQFGVDFVSSVLMKGFESACVPLPKVWLIRLWNKFTQFWFLLLFSNGMSWQIDHKVELLGLLIGLP